MTDISHFLETFSHIGYAKCLIIYIYLCKLSLVYYTQCAFYWQCQGTFRTTLVCLVKSVTAYVWTSSLAKVSIRFSPLPFGGFRQVFKHSANMRLTSFASFMLVVWSLVMYKFDCICHTVSKRKMAFVLVYC